MVEMDHVMEQQLKTLRLQNQALLLQLRQGQQKCHHVIQSLKGESSFSNAGKSSAEPVPICQNGNAEDRSVRVVTPTLEVGKARQSLKSKHKHLAQGMDTSARSETGNDDSMRSEQPNDFLLRSPKRIETPKPILKRRKIVDDNIKVDSKYQHTPTYKASPKSKRLNFSYSEVDDLEMAKARYLRENGGIESDNEIGMDSSLDGSYLDEAGKNRNKPRDGTDKNLLQEVDSIEALVRERLLLDSGNDRKNAAVVEALKKRPKSVLFEETAKHTKQTKNQSLRGRLSNLDKSISKEMSNLLDSRTADRPLLGYDWIAGILDNGPVLADKPEDYFESIKDFRRENKDECIGRGGLENVLDLSKPIEPEVQNPSHTCVHGFIINDRLFPEAMNPDENGKNVCPVCLSTRPEPSKEDPGFVRVSIPRSTLMSPYRVRPHRRRSFDSTDSISLSNHCMAGYECSKPSALPTASNLDLKHTTNGVKGQLIANESELDKLIQSFSRTSRTLNDLQSRSQFNSTATSDLQRQMRQTTDDLLNTSHSLRFELQKMEKERNLDKPLPFSTAYPAF